MDKMLTPEEIARNKELFEHEMTEVILNWKEEVSRFKEGIPKDSIDFPKGEFKFVFNSDSGEVTINGVLTNANAIKYGVYTTNEQIPFEITHTNFHANLSQIEPLALFNPDFNMDAPNVALDVSACVDMINIPKNTFVTETYEYFVNIPVRNINVSYEAEQKLELNPFNADVPLIPKMNDIFRAFNIASGETLPIMPTILSEITSNFSGEFVSPISAPSVCKINIGFTDKLSISNEVQINIPSATPINVSAVFPRIQIDLTNSHPQDNIEINVVFENEMMEVQAIPFNESINIDSSLPEEFDVNVRPTTFLLLNLQQNKNNMLDFSIDKMDIHSYTYDYGNLTTMHINDFINQLFELQYGFITDRRIIDFAGVPLELCIKSIMEKEMHTIDRVLNPTFSDDLRIKKLSLIAGAFTPPVETGFDGIITLTSFPLLLDIDFLPIEEIDIETTTGFIVNNKIDPIAISSFMAFEFESTNAKEEFNLEFNAARIWEQMGGVEALIADGLLTKK